MGSQGVDLVYELQVELNWDKDFALSACKEYSRWLQLRAKSGDFQSCKLPPSRVVAMVWNLHRQWTMDYEKTCTALGGFIHHYPPAMRMSFSREQGYAITLQTYKSHFNEDPLPSCWEPPICPSRSNVGVPDLLAEAAGRSDEAQALLTSSASHPSKAEADDDILRRNASNPRVEGQGRGVFSRPRRRAVNGSRQSPRILEGKRVGQGEDLRDDIPSDNAGLGAIVDPLSFSQGVMISNGINVVQRADGQHNETSRDVYAKESKLKRSQRGGRKVQEGYVLRPLAPGEKRRRGRPSLSEYVPVPEVTDEQENGRKTILASEEMDGVGNCVVIPTAPRSRRPPTTSKGRKCGSPEIQVPVTGLRITRETNRLRPESSRSLKSDVALTEGTRATGLGSGSKLDEHKNSVRTSKRGTPGAVRIGSDGNPLRRPRGRPRKDGSSPIPRATSKRGTPGAVRIGSDGNPLRRPRGRPRKDGSSPIPRAKRQQISRSTPGRQTESGRPAVSQSEDHATEKQDGYLSTTVVPDTTIEHGDVPIPNLETDVGPQLLDTTEPDSNGTPVHGAVSERGQDSML